MYASQYSVSLQNEEEIQQQYQRRPGQAVSVTGHGRHMESCLHTASSHFSLPIPLNVTPGFSTDIGQSAVSVKCDISDVYYHVFTYNIYTVFKYLNTTLIGLMGAEILCFCFFLINFHFYSI